MKIISYNTRHYPMMDPNGPMGWSPNPPGVTAVLVEGDIGDYTCYVGIGPVEWVALHGDKISFAEARAQFTGIEENKYRV